MSLKEQMFRSLNQKNCFGQSKYEAKQISYQKGNKGKVDGIYSKKTMSDYKKVAEQFHTWQKNKGYHFHSMDEVTTSTLKEYLLERQSKGCSAWTVSHDLSALNKIFDTTISKKECGLASRKSDNIKNNRGLANNYRNAVYANNKEMIAFISAVGVRRQSLTKLRPTDAIHNKDNIVIGFSVIEKGGKQRNCYVRKSCQKDITNFVNRHIEEKGNQCFWTKVDKNLNTHWYRGTYAENLYNELVDSKTKGMDYFDGYRNEFVNQGKLESAMQGHKEITKGYDTELLAVVSQNLGHNRIDVVYTNYLGRF